MKHPLNVNGSNRLCAVGTLSSDFDLKPEPTEQDAENFLEGQFSGTSIAIVHPHDIIEVRRRDLQHH